MHRLGELVDIYGIYDIITNIPDVRLRARLIFVMVAVSSLFNERKLTLHIEPEERRWLLNILKKGNLSIQDLKLYFNFDEVHPETGSRIIKINIDIMEGLEDDFEK